MASRETATPPPLEGAGGLKADSPSSGRTPTVIDLFAGAGGLSFGLAEAGFDVRLGLDFDKHAMSTYALNHPWAIPIVGDVREFSGSQLLDAAALDEVDLLAGGPSCQGFSTHGKRLADDPRNFLYQEFMRLVAETRPRAVLMENVKGLLISAKGRYKAEVERAFEDLGYSVNSRVLLAADFGVPQRRERVFFLASRLGEPIDFPNPTHGPIGTESTVGAPGKRRRHVSVAEALSDLPLIGTDQRQDFLPYDRPAESGYQKAMRRDSSGLWNHISRPLSAHAHSIVSKIPPGKGLRSLAPDDLPERFKRMRRISTGELRSDCTTLYHRLSPDTPSYTITCYFTNVSAGAFTHPVENRAISPREAARLQSFPDRFRFVGASIPRQIGNAVPPLLAQAVGGAVLRHLSSRIDWSAA